MERETVAIILVLTLVLIASNLISTQTETKILTINRTKFLLVPLNITRSTATIYVPAVDNEGNGIATTLKVDAQPGEGRVLTDINNLLFWVDTQYSIQVAKRVAQNITKVNISNIDLIYAIETNATLIEGPSAGAALTIATVAALENKTINKSVMITGTINPDGSIGQVGGILAKAKAAKDVNATLFLVPKGQGTQVNYVPEEDCRKIGPLTYCTIEYRKERVDITKEAGIEVREVSDIGEALKYFLV